MQPMRMHRSEFHVNLIPPSQVSIKTRKNNNTHILISKRVDVGPIVVLSINNFIDKNNYFTTGTNTFENAHVRQFNWTAATQI